jgi:hypothetical protein
MILSENDIKDRIPAIVLDIFRRYVPDAPEDCIQRVSERCGIALEQLGPGNARAFLECMREELERFTEGWKARFVTGVIAQMISRTEPDKSGR